MISTSPKVPPVKPLFATLINHVYPPLSGDGTGELDREELETRKSLRFRVQASLSMMALAKGFNVTVPFLFKSLVDDLNMVAMNVNADGGATLEQVSAAADTLAMSPFVVLTAYGFSRSMTSLLQESRNAVFASVAQRTIRLLGTTTFSHLHDLDLKYHLEVRRKESRRTGPVTAS